MAGRKVEILQWWYLGCSVFFSIFGIIAMVLAYKIRVQNVRGRQALSNVRMMLLISEVALFFLPVLISRGVLTSYLSSNTDALSLSLAPVYVLVLCGVSPVVFYLITKPQKSVWE